MAAPPPPHPNPHTTLTSIHLLRRALGRALLPDRDRRALDAAVRDLLPPNGPSEDPRRVLEVDLALGLEGQLALLGEFEGQAYQELFASLRAHPDINPGTPGARDGAALIQNGYYPTPDAEIYAALILREKPRRIIEVGSGFSTWIARATVDAAGLRTEIHVIDPSPRRPVEQVADRIERTPVEHSSLVRDGVPGGSLLFIDSSHVTRSGGDGPFLYGTVLPRLAADVLVQIHDIYLPYDYPTVYVERLYSEQYLLQALLANSTKFRPVLTTYLLSREHVGAMRKVFGDGVARDGRMEGASFWMRSVE